MLHILILAVCSIPLAVTDIREHRLPNGWNAALAGAGFAAHVWGALEQRTVEPALTSIAVGFGGLLTMLALHVVTRAGIGMGDVKLVGALGCWSADPSIVVGAVFIGSIFAGGWVLIRGYRRGERMAFGQFLLLGTWVAVALA